MTAVERAEVDIAQGHLWLARQRLSSYLVERPDEEVLDKLAGVHLAMGDLPAAGALLFVLGRDDEQSRDAVAAWRRQNNGPAAQWRSLPRVIRATATSQHVEQLKAEAVAAAQARGDRSLRVDEPTTMGERVAVAGCVLLAVVLVVFCVIVFVSGLVDVIDWVTG